MKKILAFMSMFLLVFTLVGCFGTTDPDDDKKPNTNETVSFETTHTSVILEKNSIGTVWVYVLAEVTNTGNTDLFLKAGSIDLEDASGALVDVLNLVSVYPQIISPGEKAYYYESTTLENVSENASLTVVLHPEISKSKTDKSTFPVTDIVLIDEEYWGMKATGRVENTSQEDDSSVYIAVVLFDLNNKPFAVLMTIESVNTGVKKGFSASSLSFPDTITKSSVSKFVAYAYSYQFQFDWS